LGLHSAPAAACALIREAAGATHLNLKHVDTNKNERHEFKRTGQILMKIPGQFSVKINSPTFYLVNESRKTGEKRKISQIILA
jgi:hypothetical protein